MCLFDMKIIDINFLPTLWFKNDANRGIPQLYTASYTPEISLIA